MSKKEAILDFLREPHPYPPTVREIGSVVGLSSSSTMHVYLNKLEEDGCIERKPNCPQEHSTEIKPSVMGGFQ